MPLIYYHCLLESAAASAAWADLAQHDARRYRDYIAICGGREEHDHGR